MNKLLLFILLQLLPFMINAQIQGENEVYLKGDLINPKFNGGGLATFRDYIYSRIDKSKIKVPGKLIFTFDIVESGEIKNIRIVEFKDVDFATEVIRVLKLSPKWNPALRGGKPVSMNVRFPIEFILKG